MHLNSDPLACTASRCVCWQSAPALAHQMPSPAFFWPLSLTIADAHVLSFRGYLTTQVAGGVWADKYGGKAVLGFGVIWWSIATALTPLAASLGLPALLFARACMGVGEGVAMPAMNNLLSRCFTAH